MAESWATKTGRKFAEDNAKLKSELSALRAENERLVIKERAIRAQRDTARQERDAAIQQVADLREALQSARSIFERRKRTNIACWTRLDYQEEAIVLKEITAALQRSEPKP